MDRPGTDNDPVRMNMFSMTTIVNQSSTDRALALEQYLIDRQPCTYVQIGAGTYGFAEIATDVGIRSPPSLIATAPI